MSAGPGRALRATSRHLVWSIAAVSLLACSTGTPRPEAAKARSAGPMMPQINPGPVAIKESFIARREATARLRGLALARSLFGPPWLYTADVSTDQLVVFDAATGRFERKVGERGSARGQFSGINDLFANDRVLYVAESGNQRIQLLYLPELAPVGEIGNGLVKDPVAVVARTTGGGHFMVYVIDRAGTGLVLRLIDMHLEQEASPPGTDPVFSLDVSTVTITNKPVSEQPLQLAADAEVFMHLDEDKQRLLIGSGNSLLTLNLDGSEQAPAQPVPGIAGHISGLGLFSCPGGGDKGYLVLGDRTEDAQHFQVVDRTSLQPVTRFNGLQIKDSTAMFLYRPAIAFFPFGAVYALNQSTSVGALSWQVLAAETGVRRICL